MASLDSSSGINITALEEDTNKRYRFERILGQGAYGVVFSAFDKKTKQYVAVKKVEEVFDTITDSKRMLREIKILQSMKHENVSSLIDVIVPKTQSYRRFNSVIVVLDLMDTDLYHIIYSDQHLSIDHRRYFMYQMLRGMKYIHSANILHRDLKPSNILVNANCDLKICDFGLARIQNGYNNSSLLTQGSGEANEQDFMSEYVTTRWYRAPEVLLTSGQYGPELDIWSLGCIFAELILRKPLFPGKSTLNQLSVINEKIGSPTDHDLRNITNVKARKYMKSLPQRPMVNWNELLRGASNSEIDLIKRMLTWDPTRRITAEEAIEHPFFKQLHDPMDEPITFPMETYEFERSDVTMHDMRKYLWNEIQRFHGEPTISIKRTKIIKSSLSNVSSFSSSSSLSSSSLSKHNSIH